MRRTQSWCFPSVLVERAEAFDALMGDVSASIERGDDPFLAMDDNEIDDPRRAPGSSGQHH